MLHTRISGISSPSPKMVSLMSLIFSLIITLTLSIIYAYSINPILTANAWFLRAALMIMFAAIVLCVGIVIGKLLSARAASQEITLYREFTLSLHRAQNEEDVYAILFDYLRALPNQAQIAISYTKDHDDTKWSYLSSGEMPLCSAQPDECPLFNSGGCMKSKNLEKDNPCCFLSSNRQSGSFYCLDFSSREHSKSLLQLYSPRVNAFDRPLISYIKSQVEIAILLVNNCHTFHTLNKKVHTDKLTGLFNRYFLDNYLKNQLEASMLSGQPLSLILIDIDGFKYVNDTYGHLAGDFILTYFSDIVSNSLRKSDAMVRYGGDEFIIILPCTSLDIAHTISERIKNLVSSSGIPSYDGLQLPRLACSLGISSFPECASDAAELILQADRALYDAKNSGSNRSCVFGG